MADDFFVVDCFFTNLGLHYSQLPATTILWDNEIKPYDQSPYCLLLAILSCNDLNKMLSEHEAIMS